MFAGKQMSRETTRQIPERAQCSPPRRPQGQHNTQGVHCLYERSAYNARDNNEGSKLLEISMKQTDLSISTWVLSSTPVNQLVTRVATLKESRERVFQSQMSKKRFTKLTVTAKRMIERHSLNPYALTLFFTVVHVLELPRTYCTARGLPQYHYKLQTGIGPVDIGDPVGHFRYGDVMGRVFRKSKRSGSRSKHETSDCISR